jgi:hypothetical protein
MPFVNASCDLCEEVSRIDVFQFGHLLAGLAYMSPKGGKGRRITDFPYILYSGSDNNQPGTFFRLQL